MRALATLLFLSFLAACSNGATINQDPTDADVTTGLDDTGNGPADVPVVPLDLGEGTETVEPPPKPGEFGAPCTSNEDCISGYCIEGLDGYICTKICMEDCPEGYDCVGVNVGPDVVFICVPLLDRSCEPCSSDLQCSGGRCVEFGGGSYCLSSCDAGNCKNTYSCQNVQVGNQTEPLCMPESATCECVPASVGLEKACKQKSGTNVCYGVQFCEAAGWGECNLPEEFCDGKDNDCNGVIDDGMLNPATGKYDNGAHCGVCNNSCLAMDAPHAFGICDASGAVPGCAWACEEGFFDVNDNPNDGCECEHLSNQDDPDAPGDANCDGLDGVVADGIFVAKNGDDTNPGTRELPVLTIEQGISQAQSQSKPNVYVATGVYAESILMAPGVNVYGGYSADFLYRDPAIDQTVIMGLPFTTQRPGAVNFIDLSNIATTLSGFHVFGGDAVEDGGSSYAVYLRNCDDSVRVIHNWVIAGNGRNGTHGADGNDGANGADGNPGLGAYDILKESCVDGDWNAGGAGGANQCGNTDVSGGAGGTAICPDIDESGSQPKSIPYDQTQTTTEWGGTGAGPAPGDGGEPGFDGLLWSGSSNCGVCNVPKSPDGSVFLHSLGYDGHDGANGTDGFGGTGCLNASGGVSGGLWLGTPGAAGNTGQHGSGGGGGGAGGGVETIGCQSASLVKYTDIGGSGGGAGAGGCGAGAGEAGLPGGGSFAIFVLGDAQAASVPVVADNYVQTGFGGDGGDGGAGGVGGTAGAGKSGGDSGESQGSAWCADAGGHGGNGGRGGHGGGGGGGCGGPSFGVFLHGPEPSLADGYAGNNEFSQVGIAGAGGHGGKSVGNAGLAGSDGAQAETNF